MDLSDIGKWLLIIGLVVAGAGGALWLLSWVPFLGHLPGDIRIQTETFGCFVPLGTMILLSVLLTIALNIVLRLLNK